MPQLELQSISILGVPHPIHYMDDMDGDVERIRGHVDHIAQRIKLSPKPTIQSQVRTLLHEIIHACEETTAPTQRPLTEDQVRRVAGGLWAVIAANPELARVLARVATKEDAR